MEEEDRKTLEGSEGKVRVAWHVEKGRLCDNPVCVVGVGVGQLSAARTARSLPLLNWVAYNFKI